jgi:hypothetical protein
VLRYGGRPGRGGGPGRGAGLRHGNRSRARPVIDTQRAARPARLTTPTSRSSSTVPASRVAPSSTRSTRRPGPARALPHAVTQRERHHHADRSQHRRLVK